MSSRNFSLSNSVMQEFNSLNIPNSFFYTETSAANLKSSTLYIEEESILNNLAELQKNFKIM